MPYLLLFIFFAILGTLDSASVSTRLRYKAAVGITIIFILMAGLKYETGVDWLAYSYLFDETPPIDQITSDIGRKQILGSLDLGYSILNSVIKYLGGSIQTIFFIMSLATSYFLIKAMKIYTDFLITGLLIYYSMAFFILDMSGIRQAFALSIFLYSLQFVYNRKALPYFLWIIFAALFHWSAMLFLPLYWILQRRIHTWGLITFFCFSICLFLLNIKWMENIFLTIFPQMQNDLLAGKLLVYTTNTAFSSERQLNTTTVINILLNIVIFFVLIKNRKRLEEAYPYFNLFLNIFMLQMFAYFCLYEFLEIAERMRLYFLVANFILLPYVIGIHKNVAKRLAVSSAIVLYSFLYAHSFLLESLTTVAYHPYQNYILYKVFQKESTGMERLRQHEAFHE